MDYQTDYKKFRELLKTAYEVRNKPMPTGGALDAWWEDLSIYPINWIEAAFRRHRQTSKFVPVPADIIELLPDPYMHPEPEEAFNMAPKTEYDAGYVTDEIMVAVGACSEALERRDMVAARMAFLETYRKAVSAAKVQRKPARFWYSQSTAGTHEQRLETKQQHVIEAARRGWITKQSASESLKTISNALGKDSTPLLEQLSSVADRKPLLAGNGSSKTQKALPPSSDRSDSTGQAKHLRMLIKFEKNPENKNQLIEQLKQVEGRRASA